jgi:eukaryotic-like serine/threonine-protein kinase
MMNTSSLATTSPVARRAPRTNVATGLLTPVVKAEAAVRYVQGQVIGSGGAGAVYTGWDQHLRRHVAIKRLNTTPETLQHNKEEFLREAHQLAGISHPNILSVHDICTDQKGLFMVTEYLPGKNLRDLVQVEPLNEQSFYTVVYQTLCALASTHCRGIVHNDLKPENIVVWEDGARRWQIKLLDFGCARAKGEMPTDAHGHILGSIYYVSPEVVQAKPPDFRSDIYSLGLVYYFALTGHEPFQGDTPYDIAKAHIDRDPLPIQKYRNDLPNELIAWITHLTRRQPADRPQTAVEAMDLLEQAISKKSWITKLFHGMGQK